MSYHSIHLCRTVTLFPNYWFYQNSLVRRDARLIGCPQLNSSSALLEQNHPRNLGRCLQISLSFHVSFPASVVCSCIVVHADHHRSEYVFVYFHKLIRIPRLIFTVINTDNLARDIIFHPCLYYRDIVLLVLGMCTALVTFSELSLDRYSASPSIHILTKCLLLVNATRPIFQYMRSYSKESDKYDDNAFWYFCTYVCFSRHFPYTSLAWKALLRKSTYLLFVITKFSAFRFQ